MAVDEGQRRQLFDRLSDLLGDEMADALFDQLPPPGGEAATRGQVDDLGGQLEALRRELQEGLRSLETRLSTRLDEQEARAEQREQQLEERLTNKLLAASRRDLLLHSTGQVFALVAAVAAIVGLA